MKTAYTSIVKQDGAWWTGWTKEVPGVNCQENSKDALLETLKITLIEAVEFNSAEVINAAGAIS